MQTSISEITWDMEKIEEEKKDMKNLYETGNYEETNHTSKNYYEREIYR